MTVAISRPAAALAPGDARRAPIGRALRHALGAAAVFALFTALTKEVPAVYRHVPWAEDPYDTFVSFALFFVPLALAVSGGRFVLCRAADPLPAARLDGLVRGARLVLGISIVTLAADWAGVLLTWPAARADAMAVGAIASLAVTSAVVVWATAGLARVGVPTSASLEPDGLADGLALVRVIGERVRWLRRPAAWLARLGEVRLAPVVRQHPVSSAAALAIAFGSMLALGAAREEGVAPVLGIVFGVATCGMFAFAVGGGWWLRLVGPAPSSAAYRRFVAAAAAGAAAVPASLAFRDLVWTATTGSTAHGLGDLVALVAVAGTTVFAGTLAVLTILGRPR